MGLHKFKPKPVKVDTTIINSVSIHAFSETPCAPRYSLASTMMSLLALTSPQPSRVLSISTEISKDIAHVQAPREETGEDDLEEDGIWAVLIIDH